MRPIARRALIVAILALAAGPPVPKPDIPALIQQLGGDTFAGRNEASRQLTQIGGPALPELRRAMKSTDAEIRRRAKRLVNSIERNVYAEVRRFEGHGGSVNAVAFSPDGKRAASGDNSHVRIWEVATGKELLKDDTHRDRVMAVAFSPDGKILASGSEDRKVLLYDAETLRVLHTFRVHRADVRAVAFTPDGKRLLSADLNGGIYAWSVPDGKRLGKLPNDGLGHVLCVVPIDDQNALVCPTNDNSAILRAIDPKDAAVHRFDRHTGKVVAAAVTRDRKHLLTASQDKTLIRWSLTTRKSTHVLSGHTAPVSCVAVAPDGKLAVSGGADMELRLWDLDAGRAIRGLPGHTKTIWSVAVSPDGKYALSGSADGTMRLWSLGR
jgi:WD40 repeat protein